MNGERDATIRALLPLVRALARRLAHRVPGSDLDDLIGDGQVGLIRAVDGYDASRGTSLRQYARRVVLGAMLNGIRRLDPVSERVRRTVRVAERARYRLAVERGAFPAERELLLLAPGLDRARAAAHRGTPLSLDAPVPLGSGGARSGDGDPAAIAIAALERARLYRALRALPVRLQTIVVAHYFGERPLRAISAELAISPQRASQLHGTALRRIRARLATSA